MKGNEGTRNKEKVGRKVENDGRGRKKQKESGEGLKKNGKMKSDREEGRLQ